MGSLKKVIHQSNTTVGTLMRNLRKIGQDKPAPEPAALVGRNIFGTFDASKPHRRARKV